MAERKSCIRYSVGDRVVFLDRWRDRRFKANGQKEAGDNEAGGQEAGPPQGLWGHRGRHQSQD